MKNITKDFEAYIKLIEILTDLALAYKKYAESLEEKLDKGEGWEDY